MQNWNSFFLRTLIYFDPQTLKMNEYSSFNPITLFFSWHVKYVSWQHLSCLHRSTAFKLFSYSYTFRAHIWSWNGGMEGERWILWAPEVPRPLSWVSADSSLTLLMFMQKVIFTGPEDILGGQISLPRWASKSW